jgi:hypothetical protein
MTRRLVFLVAALTLGLAVPAVAEAGLVHSWPAEGTALDVTGAANGTHTGSYVTDGLIGQAFTYGGLETTDFGNVGNTTASEFTIAFAVRTTQTAPSVPLLTKRGFCDASQPFWDIHMSANSVGYETYESLAGGNKGVGMNAVLGDGFWHTLTFTRTGSTLTGYVDGEQRAIRTDATANVTNATSMKAGTSPCVGADGTVNLEGAIDEIRIADNANADLQPPPAMVNASPPAITGTASLGSPLTCSDGTWRYPLTRGLTRQWLRDGKPIDGATGPTYTLAAADQGTSISCRVTAANQSGPASADSGGLAVPSGSQPQPPSVPESPTAPESQPAGSSATPKPVSITSIATLPPTKLCVSRRKFPIRLRGVKTNRIVRAQIKLNGRQVRNITGKALSLPIDLRGLPKGTFTVEILTTDSAGKKIVGKRAYRTCAPRRR